jgi:MOSC domain-containing protein YiiM
MKIISLAISRKKGTRKTPVAHAAIVRNHGLKGDAHAGDWHRQVSLLAVESIEKARRQGLNVAFGDFAENIATEGIDLVNLPVGARLKFGEQVILEISQIGKECHKKCAIYYQAGDCIMPKEGVFARVVSGGEVRLDDPIELVG